MTTTTTKNLTQEEKDKVLNTLRDCLGLVECNCAAPKCDGDCTHADLMASIEILLALGGAREGE